MTARLVIGHGNVFAANRTPGRAIAAIREADADSFGINEGNRIAARLRAIPGHRVTVSSAPGRARETPILTRSSLPNLGAISMQISAPADPAKWAPARWLTASLFQHPVGRVAHINVHLNAVVTDVPVSTPRVREYAASTEALVSVVRFLRGEGYTPVVTGDVNMTRTGASSVPWSAHAVLEAIGLTVRSRGVDIVAHEARDLERVGWETIESSETGADHPFLVATFKARR